MKTRFLHLNPPQTWQSERSEMIICGSDLGNKGNKGLVLWEQLTGPLDGDYTHTHTQGSAGALETTMSEAGAHSRRSCVTSFTYLGVCVFVCVWQKNRERLGRD